MHGIKDYCINEVTGLSCAPDDEMAFASAIQRLYEDKELYSICCVNASKKAMEFDIKSVRKMMEKNYKDVLL